MAQNKNIVIGKKGEQIASEYLTSLGWKILERNWHYSKNAEIDIIAEDKNTLVFVEVKTRSSLSFGHPFEAITKSKIQKIYTAIYAYLDSSDKKYSRFRFDGIAVIGTNKPSIEHIKDIGRF